MYILLFAPLVLFSKRRHKTALAYLLWMHYKCSKECGSPFLLKARRNERYIFSACSVSVTLVWKVRTHKNSSSVANHARVHMNRTLDHPFNVDSYIVGRFTSSKLTKLWCQSDPGAHQVVEFMNLLFSFANRFNQVIKKICLEWTICSSISICSFKDKLDSVLLSLLYCRFRLSLRPCACNEHQME